jgi:hypothetical protein
VAGPHGRGDRVLQSAGSWVAVSCAGPPHLCSRSRREEPALAAGGLAALIPGKPGPKGGHKLTGPVLDHLQALLEQDPRLTFGELAAQAAQRFGIQVHPRSVRRALERRLAGPGRSPPDRRRPKAAAASESGSAAAQPGPPPAARARAGMPVAAFVGEAVLDAVGS